MVQAASARTVRIVRTRILCEGNCCYSEGFHVKEIAATAKVISVTHMTDSASEKSASRHKSVDRVIIRLTASWYLTEAFQNDSHETDSQVLQRLLHHQSYITVQIPDLYSLFILLSIEDYCRRAWSSRWPSPHTHLTSLLLWLQSQKEEVIERSLKSH